MCTRRVAHTVRAFIFLKKKNINVHIHVGAKLCSGLNMEGKDWPKFAEN